VTPCSVIEQSGTSSNNPVSRCPSPLQANEGEGEGEVDPHFEPVIKLDQQVETKTHEEDEDVLFKM
jgi:hypothetical protein